MYLSVNCFSNHSFFVYILYGNNSFLDHRNDFSYDLMYMYNYVVKIITFIDDMIDSLSPAGTYGL